MTETPLNLADDDFTLFGLPQRFELDREALDERRRELQALVHPDRFAAEGASAQRLAMQWSVRVNEAYRRLRDPVSRAAYLCGLRGAPIDAERNTAMPPAFLAKQLAWREALDEASGGAAVKALEAEVDAAEQALLGALESLLGDGASPKAAESAAGEVRALMFVARFREDLEQRLTALEG